MEFFGNLANQFALYESISQIVSIETTMICNIFFILFLFAKSEKRNEKSSNFRIGMTYMEYFAWIDSERSVNIMNDDDVP